MVAERGSELEVTLGVEHVVSIQRFDDPTVGRSRGVEEGTITRTKENSRKFQGSER